MDAKNVIIALVVVVAIAGIGFFALDNAEEASDKPVATDSNLMIFGNANNDDFVDDEDIKVIEEIMKTGWDKAKYPYADANNDKTVDQADIDYIKKMMAKEPMDIWYMDWEGDVNKVTVPIGKMITMGYDSMTATQILGKHNDVVGRDDMKMFPAMRDETLNATIYTNAAPVAKTPFSVDIGLLTNLLDNQKIDLILAGEHYCKKQIDKFNALGISLVNMNFMNREWTAPCMLTYGYMLDNEETAHNFVKFMEDLSSDIEKTVASMPKAEQEVQAITMLGSTIFAPSDDGSYVEWATLAGSTSPVTKEMLDGASNKPVAPKDTWHLIEAFNVPYLVCPTGFNYGNGVEDYARTWNTIEEKTNWDKMIPDHYPTGIGIMNWHLFPWLGVAYVAEFLHGDYFEEGYADKWHQQYIDSFIPDLQKINYKAADHIFLAEYEDVKDYLGKPAPKL